MPRRLRRDEPGRWFHVMNRGIAKRPIFESARDARCFLAHLARSVRAGLVEVHAFCVMTTHFHLLVRSPDARLAQAMQRVQLRYARWFNRSRLRDGPVFRGRYRSVAVDSSAHWHAVLAYIERNPVEAGIVTVPSAYPYGSARRFASPRPPRWLSAERALAVLAERGFSAGDGSASYDRAMLGLVSATSAEMVERRMRDADLDGGVPADDPLDDLVRASAPSVQVWMQHKARLADGTVPGMALLAAATVRRLVAQCRALDPNRIVRVTRRSRPVWDLIESGLLRMVCGLAFFDTARRLSTTTATAYSRSVEHFRALRTDPGYAALASEIVAEGLRIDFPCPLRPLDLPRAAPGMIAEAGPSATVTQ